MKRGEVVWYIVVLLIVLFFVFVGLGLLYKFHSGMGDLTQRTLVG